MLVEVIYDGGLWAVVRAGQIEAVTKTRAPAVDRGRELARRGAPTELVIRRRDGSVLRQHRYVNPR